jgi:RNA recognition motif-containing protein
MAIKLFVGKLSYDTTEESLRTEFAKYGTVVSAAVIIDRDSNRSKGFGFIEMETQEGADAAIAALHEKEFEGRMIVVSVAKPREDRPSGGNNFRSGFQRN